ncbi:hypothetical protein [Gorillibacterium sp. CAU 1737]|uniref:hypothetical protein n=1 Tax=Gorillibacterium sp. CAU 1737 TaxID=3140362 RepID=UPI003261683C
MFFIILILLFLLIQTILLFSINAKLSPSTKDLVQRALERDGIADRMKNSE